VSIDNDLRDLLNAKANDVHTSGEVPAAVTARVKRRIVLNSAAIGMVVVALGVGAFAGVRTLGNGRAPTGGSLASSGATPACTSGQLRAVGSLQGAAGSRIGKIDVTNFSDKTCTLSGRPTITLLDSNLKPITSGVTITNSAPGWQVNRSPQPAGWPVVTLAPGKVASVRLRWSNWCRSSAPLWHLGIPGSSTVNVYGMESDSAPPCNGPGLPSIIERGPFEPRLAA